MPITFRRMDVANIEHGQTCRYFFWTKDLTITGRVEAHRDGVDILGKWPTMGSDDLEQLVVVTRKAYFQHKHLKEGNNELIPEDTLLMRVATDVFDNIGVRGKQE